MRAQKRSSLSANFLWRAKFRTLCWPLKKLVALKERHRPLCLSNVNSWVNTIPIYSSLARCAAGAPQILAEVHLTSCFLCRLIAWVMAQWYTRNNAIEFILPFPPFNYGWVVSPYNEQSTSMGRPIILNIKETWWLAWFVITQSTLPSHSGGVELCE